MGLAMERKDFNGEFNEIEKTQIRYYEEELMEINGSLLRSAGTSKEHKEKREERRGGSGERMEEIFVWFVCQI